MAPIYPRMYLPPHGTTSANLAGPVGDGLAWLPHATKMSGLRPSLPRRHQSLNTHVRFVSAHGDPQIQNPIGRSRAGEGRSPAIFVAVNRHINMCDLCPLQETRRSKTLGAYPTQLKGEALPCLVVINARMLMADLGPSLEISRSHPRWANPGLEKGAALPSL